MPKKFFIIEDEEDMQEFYKYLFEKEGYDVEIFSTAEDALNRLKITIPDLIILDLMLPKMSGFEFNQILKNNTEYSSIPVIIMSARNDEFDMVTGINIGCEDYITKPFSSKVLIAKVNAILKREENKCAASANEVLVYDKLVVDCSEFKVTVDGNPIELTPAEFKLLAFLMKTKNRVYSRAQIGENIFDRIDYDCDRSIDILILRVRKKIVPYDVNLETIYSVGYSFRDK